MAKNFFSSVFGGKKDAPPANAAEDESQGAGAATDAAAKVNDEEPRPETSPSRKGLFARLKAGLSKSAGQLSGGVATIFAKKRLDDEKLEELEELLIACDLGVAAAARVTVSLAKGRFDKEISDREIKEALAGEVAASLAPFEAPFEVDCTRKPH
ncbi:MAG TPA: signal recognition particle receptor subunit alpha, partial [Parvularculaceae bacterium]|nr:signal recognition particle receptor subunit alpha [Parvularculaceae bacterium]